MTVKTQSPKQASHVVRTKDGRWSARRTLSPSGMSGIAIGGFAGAAVAGPIGAAVGMVIGVAAGEAIERHFPSPPREDTTPPV